MVVKYLIVFITICTICGANPYFQRRFQQLVDKDKCLKKCMDKVSEYGGELSLLKNTNLKEYFIGHDTRCHIITNAEKCVEECEIESNPFKLNVMETHCTNETYEKISELKECFEKNGDKINNNCEQNCGIYKEITDQVHELTRIATQNPGRNLAYEILDKSNRACGVYKCMQRCNVDQVNQECGEDKGDIVQSLIQDISNAQKADMDRLNLVQIMIKNTPKQCDYMYNPQSLFGEEQSSEVQSNVDVQEQSPDVQSNTDNVQEQDETRTLSDVQLEVYNKQLEVLEKQDKVLDKEDGKLDLEISLLQQKQEAFNQRQFIY